MRATTRALIEHYVEHLELEGDVLEVGGHELAKCSVGLFPAPRFRYHDLNLVASDIPDTIIADITGCADEIPDESFDVIVSSDVFEHIDRPWLAAQEISRILRPGGIAITVTLFAWRNHPCPIDYWRYSAECLEFLFADLECLEKGYDLSQRRADQPGFWLSGADSVPVDQLGGWREHWSVYCVNRKGAGRPVPRFKDSGHPLAHHLRSDTQGTVTNPRLTGTSVPAEPDPASAGGVDDRLSRQIATLTARIDVQSKHLQRLERQVARTGQPLPIRAFRSARRRVRKAMAAL